MSSSQRSHTGQKVVPPVTLGKSLHFIMFRGSSPFLPSINICPWDFDDLKRGKPEDTGEVRDLQRR